LSVSRFIRCRSSASSRPRSSFRPCSPAPSPSSPS
jgi:hypothetical protein